MHKNYTTNTKSTKAKRYINPKNQKEKNKYMATSNLGGIDLNRISGSSHSSNYLNYINNRNIIPFESNGFSVYGTGSVEGDEREKKLNNKNINYTYYLTNNNKNNNEERENNKINNQNYNSELYTPFYNLIENINKNSNNNDNNNNINNFSSKNFLNNNHIVEIHNKPNNMINENNSSNYKFNQWKEKVKKYEINNNKKMPKKDLLKNHNINNYHQLKIETNNFINEPKEEFKTSIMEKTIDLLKNNNKTNYNINNINYDYNYNSKNQNDINNYINNENISLNHKISINELNNNDTKFKTSFIKNKNNKLTYNYLEDKNNDKINYNNEYNTKTSIYDMIKEFNNSLNRTNRSRQNEINENNANNQNNIINKTNINNNIDYNSCLNKTKSFYNFEGNGDRATDDIKSKYFLRSIFDQNSTSKFVNDFNYYSPSRQKGQFKSFTNFEFIKKEKKSELNQTPRAFTNIQNSENRLEKLLKSIPSHKKDKNIYEYNCFSKKLNSNINENKSKKKYEEIDNIMPPNFLVNKNTNN